MTIIESGVIAGISAGAIIGGVMGKAYGGVGIVGGLLAGMVSGGVAGWFYSFLMLFLLSLVGVLWQAARKRHNTVPTETDMDVMTGISIRGIFLGSLIALACWFSLGWLYALIVALAIGGVTACIAVGRCELE
jgi:hypothetical protein